jgi:hypothetical protein
MGTPLIFTDRREQEMALELGDGKGGSQKKDWACALSPKMGVIGSPRGGTQLGRLWSQPIVPTTSSPEMNYRIKSKVSSPPIRNLLSPNRIEPNEVFTSLPLPPEVSLPSPMRKQKDVLLSTSGQNTREIPLSVFTSSSQKETGDTSLLISFNQCRITLPLSMSGGSGAAVYGCEIGGLQCAMKEFRFSNFHEEKSGEQRGKILQEIEILRKLSHPNIVRYLAHTSKRSSVRLFMTRYESTLRKEIQTRVVDVRDGIDEPFSPDEVCRVMLHIIKGLIYLHLNGIIHRDLKSDNLFVNYNERGNIDNVVIADFDTAKHYTLHELRTFCGTRNYVAPEVMLLLRGSGSDDGMSRYTTKVDIWSLGMVLYEVLTLQLPYSSTPIEEVPVKICKGIRPNLPSPPTGIPTADNIERYRSFIDLYEKCTYFEPKLRPTPEEVEKILLSCLVDERCGGRRVDSM